MTEKEMKYGLLYFALRLPVLWVSDYEPVWILMIRRNTMEMITLGLRMRISDVRLYKT